MRSPWEDQLWLEFVRAEERVDRLCSLARDHLVGTDVAVTLGGRGREAVDTALLDKSSSSNLQ